VDLRGQERRRHTNTTMPRESAAVSNRRVGGFTRRGRVAGRTSLVHTPRQGALGYLHTTQNSALPRQYGYPWALEPLIAVFDTPKGPRDGRQCFTASRRAIASCC
jgi:hypothetical protein